MNRAIRKKHHGRIGSAAVILVVFATALGGTLAWSSNQSLIETQPPEPSVAARPGSPDRVLSDIGTDSSVGIADGILPAGATVFDDQYPGIANLDPDLLAALRAAASAAWSDNIEFHVNSGWRSEQYQVQLVQDAVAQYGSESEAAKWVAPPETSLHVSGDAVDLGPDQATEWLSQYGVDYGLCQIYHNEPWHFELHPQAQSDGCPPMYDNAAQDPRIQG